MIVLMKLLWRPEVIQVEIDEHEIVYALKENFCTVYNQVHGTQIVPDSIKLSYKGKQISNSEILSECGVTDGAKVMASKF